MSDIEGPEFAGSEAELRYENNKPVTPEDVDGPDECVRCGQEFWGEHDCATAVADVDVETVRERLWRSRGSYDGKPVHNLKGTLPAEFAALSRLETRLRTAEADLAASKFGEREWHDKALEQQMQRTLTNLEEEVLWRGEADAEVKRLRADRDMLEANTIGILAHERIVESLRAEVASLEATERDVEWFCTENARLREALADCLRHLDFEAGDDDQYATGARNRARALLAEPERSE